jgi:hypothetical protein
MHDDDHYRDNAAMGSHSPYTSYDVPNAHFKGVQLIADPIHGYIPFTVPLEPLQGEGEAAESDLIDAPWMQRLRAIAQLQSARWVFPAAEHSRFQHSLGTMHIAGRFAQALYPTLCEVEPGCPSRPYIESLLRISGLLHDLGHGPLCHFFDDHYLSRFAISHEMIGHRIILQVLADIISRIRRSPSGAFASHETLEPRYVAYLMQKKLSDDPGMPRWLRLLKPVLAGVYTAGAVGRRHPPLLPSRPSRRIRADPAVPPRLGRDHLGFRRPPGALRAVLLRRSRPSGGLARQSS